MFLNKFINKINLNLNVLKVINKFITNVAFYSVDFCELEMQNTNRCQVSGVKCQVSGVKCQVSGARCQVSGVKCQVSDVK